MVSSRSALAAILILLSLAACAVAEPGSSYTGTACGDIRAGTCPGKPFAGSSFKGAICSSSAFIWGGVPTSFLRRLIRSPRAPRTA